MDLARGKRRGAEINHTASNEIMLIVACNYPKFLSLGMFGIT
jgi:hypothetical protein